MSELPFEPTGALTLLEELVSECLIVLGQNYIPPHGEDDDTDQPATNYDMHHVWNLALAEVLGPEQPHLWAMDADDPAISEVTARLPAEQQGQYWKVAAGCASLGVVAQSWYAELGDEQRRGGIAPMRDSVTDIALWVVGAVPAQNYRWAWSTEQGEWLATPPGNPCPSTTPWAALRTYLVNAPDGLEAMTFAFPDADEPPPGATPD